MRIHYFVFVVVGMCSGCFWATNGELDEVRTELKSHQKTAEANEKTLRDEIGQKLDAVEQTVDKAANVVTRNSADAGAQVQELRLQLSTLEGQLAELRHQLESSSQSDKSAVETRLARVEKKVGIEPTHTELTIPTDKVEHYTVAYRAYQAADYATSRTLFREYIQRYANDPQTDNAQYWIGTSFLAQDKPATALGELRKVIDTYPESDAVDESLLDMAAAFFKLHACTDAKGALQALIKNHPRSTLVKRAKDRLKEINKAPKAQCTS